METNMDDELVPAYDRDGPNGSMRYLVIKRLKMHSSYRDDPDYYYKWNVIDTANSDTIMGKFLTEKEAIEYASYLRNSE